MSQKQLMPKSEDLSRSLEINAIWTFDTEFQTIFNKSCTNKRTITIGRFRIFLQQTLHIRVGYPCHVMSTFGSATHCAQECKLKTGFDLYVPYYTDQHCLSPARICVSQLYVGAGVKKSKNFHLSPGQVHQNFYLSCYQITCPCQGKINYQCIFYLSAGHWVKIYACPA